MCVSELLPIKAVEKRLEVSHGRIDFVTIHCISTKLRPIRGLRIFDGINAVVGQMGEQVLKRE